MTTFSEWCKSHLCKELSPGRKVCMHWIIIGAVVAIFAYGFIVRKFIKKDVLEKQLVPCQGLDGWAILHFIFYFTLAYIWPEYLFEIALVGVAWELIETWLGSKDIKLFGRRIKLVGATDDKGNVLEDDKNVWWYGRVSDIAYNLLGAVLGWKLSQIKPVKSLFNQTATSAFVNSTTF
jgi:hypothetical protein